MKNWYSFKNRSGTLDISIHDEIGLWGISAKEFIRDLRAQEGVRAINLSIHSPGGSVLDGFAMYNALKNHPAKVYGSVEGIAASAASFVLMAADVIEMPEDAFLMIHNAWGVAIGDSDEMRDTADVIDKLQDSIVNIYATRTGLDESEVRDMMSAETWMNGADALEKGFADTITEPVKVAAKINRFGKYFKNLPAEAERVDRVEKIETIKDFEECLRDAGLGRKLALALTSRARELFVSDSEPDPGDFSKLAEALDRVKSRIEESTQPTG